jgi:L-lactate dehydrogenase complex protein LldE
MPIALFSTCVVDQVVPEIGLAALDVLDRIGHPAVFPQSQTCCGQPFFNSGYRPEARRLARATIATLQPFDAVVVPSGSCAAMIRVHFRELFPDHDPLQPAIAHLAERTFEFSEFLSKKLAGRSLGARYPDRVTFHDGCHSVRELGITGQPRQLLASVEGCELRELTDGQQCCGFGGAFSVKFDRISASMGNAKVDAIVATGASAVVSGDPSCLLQIRGILERRGLAVTTLHLAQVLASWEGE